MTCVNMSSVQIDLVVIVLALWSIRLAAAAGRPNVLFILADDMGQWAARSALPYISNACCAVSYSHYRVGELQPLTYYTVCNRSQFHA